MRCLAATHPQPGAVPGNRAAERRPPLERDAAAAVAVCARSAGAQTAEEAADGLTMPRFVILEHDHPARHWDLLLESEGVLRAWRLPAPPQGDALVQANFDHRLFYLDYEGPV